MKEYFCTAVGLIGGAIASLYGNWSAFYAIRCAPACEMTTLG